MVRGRDPRGLWIAQMHQTGPVESWGIEIQVLGGHEAIIGVR